MNEDRKQMQNLLSLCILLGGLFIGSLFVDVMQLFTKSGFSKHAIRNADVIETGGKTWVGYQDPKVTLTVLADSTCDACDPSQAITWIRRVIPTVTVRSVEYSSEEGQRLAVNHELSAIPTFLFDSAVKETGFFTQASSLFSERGDGNILDMTKIGQTPGKFIKLPEITGRDISTGPADAKLTVTEYLDFQCPYSKLFHSATQKMEKEYPDDIRFVRKHLPLSFHPQAENAALASECANEQGKFQPYGDMLFAKQDEWSRTAGTTKFKNYAWTLRLDYMKFSSCLDSKKYGDKVRSDAEEAKKFGISGTPGTFVGNRFINGAVSYDELKTFIDAKLAE